MPEVGVEATTAGDGEAESGDQMVDSTLPYCLGLVVGFWLCAPYLAILSTLEFERTNELADGAAEVERLPRAGLAKLGPESVGEEGRRLGVGGLRVAGRGDSRDGLLLCSLHSGGRR